MKGRKHPKLLYLCMGTAFTLLLVLLAVPGFRSGTAALLNLVFEISESQNAYLYERLPGADPAWLRPAVFLIAAQLLAFFLSLAMFSRPLAGLVLLAGSTCVQAYFGISFPAAVNMVLFLCGMLFLIHPSFALRDGLFLLAVLLPVCILTGLFLPGTDSSVEQLSEQVRDWLSAQSDSGDRGEDLFPETVVETRHVNERSLDEGNREARGTDGYRLIQLERMEIAKPDWFSLVRILLPFFGMLLLLTAPFVPFILLNRRHLKTMERRRLFEDPDNRAAAAAMFRHICAYLRTTGHLEPNVPYRLCSLPGMTAAFAEAFHEAAVIWERAVYSEHSIETGQRAAVQKLLEETEKRLYDQADRWQKFRLRTVECLHL